MTAIHMVRFTARRPEERRSESVPIGVAIGEAHTTITGRRRNAIRWLQEQAAESPRKVRATG